MSDKAGTVYEYEINADDLIVRVDDNWQQFAAENEGLECCSAESVVGKPLWDFIADKETRHLYRILLQKIRNGHPPIVVPFRCDSPDTRRFLEMTMIAKDDKGVVFRNKLLKVEKTEPVELLSPSAKRSQKFVKICSLCKRIKLPDDGWVETEKAVELLKLFEEDELPQLSHVVCPICYDKLLADID